MRGVLLIAAGIALALLAAPEPSQTQPGPATTPASAKAARPAVKAQERTRGPVVAHPIQTRHSD